MAPNQLSLFISSTCYNLVDLRAELGGYLSSQGFHVRMSESVDSGFSVDPGVDSIESCLANVRAADAVLCIIDGRYGRDLGGRYGDRPATPVEVDEARKHDKALFYFIRTNAYSEFQQLRANLDSKHQWVEKGNRERALAWTQWVESLFTLPEHASRSNWFDTFSTSIDLKPIVLKRLVDAFPRQSIHNAMQPDRLVRLTFRPRSFDNAMGTVYGRFVNVGVGPAINIRVSIASTKQIDIQQLRQLGGLAEGESISESDKADMPFEYRGGKIDPLVVACEYENRFGDAYRVERSFTIRDIGNNSSGYVLNGKEMFYVGLPNTAGQMSWVEAT